MGTFGVEIMKWVAVKFFFEDCLTFGFGREFNFGFYALKEPTIIYGISFFFIFRVLLTTFQEVCLI